MKPILITLFLRFVFQMMTGNQITCKIRNFSLKNINITDILNLFFTKIYIGKCSIELPSTLQVTLCLYPIPQIFECVIASQN